jgi:hypothetical protein
MLIQIRPAKLKTQLWVKTNAEWNCSISYTKLDSDLMLPNHRWGYLRGYLVDWAWVFTMTIQKLLWDIRFTTTEV